MKKLTSAVAVLCLVGVVGCSTMGGLAGMFGPATSCVTFTDQYGAVHYSPQLVPQKIADWINFIKKWAPYLAQTFGASTDIIPSNIGLADCPAA